MLDLLWLLRHGDYYGAGVAAAALSQADAAMRVGEHFVTRTLYLESAPPPEVQLGEPVWDRHVTTFARSVEDALSRRTRALLLDAHAAVEAAPETAAILAKTLGKDAAWEKAQIDEFLALAKGYLAS